MACFWLMLRVSEISVPFFPRDTWFPPDLSPRPLHACLDCLAHALYAYSRYCSCCSSLPSSFAVRF